MSLPREGNAPHPEKKKKKKGSSGMGLKILGSGQYLKGIKGEDRLALGGVGGE